MWNSTKSFLDNLTKEKLVGYFLILWGASFFFEAIQGFILASYSYEGARAIASNDLGILVDVIYLPIAAVLVLLGLKILGIKMGTTAPPTSTTTPPIVPAAKFCSYCGKELTPDSINFCTNCGQRIQ